MKSTKITDNKYLKYPCLMESNLNGAVVLFVSERKGVQVTKKENPGDGELGHYSEDWNASYDTEIWKPFYGQIILENTP